MSKENFKTTEKTQTDPDLNDALVRDIVHESAKSAPEASPDLFARIEENLPSEEKAPEQKSGQNRQAFRDWLTRWKDYLLRPHVGWGLAAAQAVVLCIFLIFSPGNHKYDTLSMVEQAQNQMASIDLYVMFHDQATMEEIEQLLYKLQGRIKDGPTTNGIYLVAFADHSINQPDNLLKKLHKSKIITFAEQVY